MNPVDLKKYLRRLADEELQISVMMWGPPGIGKSSIVAQLADDFNMGLIDLRLSQLAPSDLRGLPVPDKEEKMARWFPPEFLPRDGRGILFLDEVNMAPPTMQGIAQQLILDRKVGSYSVPEGWFIWAAGNRKEDRASVFEMPSPVANRFVHLVVNPDYESFRTYAARVGLHEQVQSFLAFRSELLFKMNTNAPAWPSPRSWEMASALHSIGLDISSAVGEGTAGEFYTYLDVYTNLPDLDKILSGKGHDLSFPSEASIRYAATVGLSVRLKTAAEAEAALHWLFERASREFTQLFLKNAVERLRDNGQLGALLQRIEGDADLQSFIEHMFKLMGERL